MLPYQGLRDISEATTSNISVLHGMIEIGTEECDHLSLEKYTLKRFVKNMCSYYLFCIVLQLAFLSYTILSANED